MIERDPLCMCGHRESKHDPSTTECCAWSEPNQARCVCQLFVKAVDPNERPLVTDNEINLTVRR